MPAPPITNPPTTDHAPVETDVVIVGAGPAGCAAAIVLRRRGLDVVVIDRASFPRDKICGDGLTTAALRDLEDLGLDPETVPSWLAIDDVVVRSPDGHEVMLPLPRGRGTYAAVARRRELDAALVELARSTGAEIRESTALATVSESTGAGSGAGAVTVTTGSGGVLRARHLIAADGMWSPTRKALGIGDPTYRGEWHAFRQYFTDVSARASRELIVWFEADLLPGYAWSFPLADGTANVGFGILRDGGSYKVADMAPLWREFLHRPHVRAFLGPDAMPEGPHRAWPIPARVDRAVLSHGRTLIAGDAAAATDPMTGEGIGQALATGRWAADAIADHPGDPGAIAAAYEFAVHRGLAVDHRFATALTAILRRPVGARAAVRVTGCTDWTRRNFARWLFEDYPRAMMFTPGRWHRGMFAGQGAYRGTHADTTH